MVKQDTRKWAAWSGDPEMERIAKQSLSLRSAAHEAAFFLPYLRPGMHLLDCGCSEGSITFGLAEAVAPGKVTGIDIRPNPIKDATAEAAKRGIANVVFQVAAASKLPFPDGSFDAVFAHALLEWLPHLKDKIASEMHRVLKPGGFVGLRSPTGTHFQWSRDEAVERWRSAGDRWGKSVGKDMQIGQKLGELLCMAHFEMLRTSVSASPPGTADSIRAYFMLLAGSIARSNDYTDTMIRHGWLTKEDLLKASSALMRLANQTGAYVADVWAEAVAKKPG